MAELECVITLPDGRVNGYRHSSGFAAESVVPPGVESQATFPEAQHRCGSVAPAITDSTQTAAAPDQPTKPTGGAQPAPEETSREATGSAKKSLADPAKPVKKARPKDPRIKYVPQAKLDAEQAKLEKLSQAALAGDTEAVDQLRVELDNRPHVWQRLADLQRRIELKMIELIAGNDPLQAQAFRRRCSEFRRQILDGEPASLATKMAAARAVSCWMFCQLLELRALESPAELRNVRALEQAERRFQVAMRTFHMSRLADLQLQRLASQNDADRG